MAATVSFGVIFSLTYLVCVLRPSVHGKLTSITMKSNKVTTNADHQILSEHVIHKRALFNSRDQTAILDLHNEKRRIPGASNMNKLTWSPVLADMADGWAGQCEWRHGQPYVRQPPYKHIGQNLFATSGTFDALGGVTLWYDEVKFYNYDTGGCVRGEQCGHYTQMVWATSRELGCGYAYCPRLAGSSVTNNAYLLVCNYGPAGNWRGEQPYQLGPACSECTSGRAWCQDGLCVDRCDGPKCQCNAYCDNCGSVNSVDCTCSCKDGWTSNDCSTRCANNHENCGANPGWPVRWCDSAHQYVIDNCPLMCGGCQAPPPGGAPTCSKPPRPADPRDESSAANVPNTGKHWILVNILSTMTVLPLWSLLYMCATSWKFC